MTTPPTNAVTGPFDSRGNYVEAWADTPEKWHRPAAPANSPSATPTLVSQEPASLPIVKVIEPKPNVTSPAPIQQKPKVSVAATPKPKPKPQPKPVVVRYTIKKGDTLGRIASSQGVSLSALRRANGLSGDIIHPGKTLTIPK